jgi:hypothetical protein
MKHLLMGVSQVCSFKGPWVKIGLGPGACIWMSDFRAIMALLFVYIFVRLMVVLEMEQ